jgi:hypothetical protein
VNEKYQDYCRSGAKNKEINHSASEMNTNDRLHLEQSIANVLDSFGHMPFDMQECRTLVHAGEYGVAIEYLCTQLVEHDIVISVVLKESIAAIAERLTICDSYWRPLLVA